PRRQRQALLPARGRPRRAPPARTALACGSGDAGQETTTVEYGRVPAPFQPPSDEPGGRGRTHAGRDIAAANARRCRADGPSARRGIFQGPAGFARAARLRVVGALELWTRPGGSDLS